MLAGRSGSELYAAEIAEALLSRGHSPLLYSPAVGALARDLQARSIPVVSDLRRVTEPPDVIHGQHTHETLTALLAFPGVPAVRLYHGWNDTPPQPFPRILRHVAVDETVRDRLVSEWGIPPARIEVLLNFVDPAALPMRGPLPDRPGRALVFSNSASHHLDVIRRACRARGIEVDAAGADIGRVVERPGDLLPAYDLVFAKARCAMEAMAVGAAVILCDRAGLGPMVTSEAFDELRRVNFGLRALRLPLSDEAVDAELARYSPADAAIVSSRMRAEGDVADAVDRLIEIYRELLEAWQASGGSAADEELRCAADYLRQVGAEPAPRVAASALLKSAYVRLRQTRAAGWLLPSPRRALRIYRGLRRG